MSPFPHFNNFQSRRYFVKLSSFGAFLFLLRLFQRDESNFVQLLHCDSFLPSLSPSLLSIPVVSPGDEKEGNSWKRSTRQPSLASLSSSINRNTERIGKERIEGATRVRGCLIASHDLCVLLTTPRTVTPPLPLCFETSALQLLVTNHERGSHREREKRN